MARDGGYPDPVNPTYEATGAMYDKVASRLLRDLSSEGRDPSLGFVFLCTNNENAVRRAVAEAEDRELLGKNNDNGRGETKLNFAQVYGMAEQISLPLGM